MGAKGDDVIENINKFSKSTTISCHTLRRYSDIRIKGRRTEHESKSPDPISHKNIQKRLSSKGSCDTEKIPKDG